MVPALAGLGAPHWDQSARGAILGLTRGSSSAHITRAALESICYQVNDLVKAKEADSGLKVSEMRVDGGAVVNNLLMQFQADIMQHTKVVRPQVLETTALGAAYLAGLAVGFWKDIDELKAKWSCERVFESEMEKERADKFIRGWNKALGRAKNWEE